MKISDSNAFSKLKRGYKIDYNRRGGITKRDIVLTIIYIYKEYIMKYSGNSVTNEEELDVEVNHFYFLSKYNLL